MRGFSPQHTAAVIWYWAICMHVQGQNQCTWLCHSFPCCMWGRTPVRWSTTHTTLVQLYVCIASCVCLQSPHMCPIYTLCLRKTRLIPCQLHNPKRIARKRHSAAIVDNQYKTAALANWIQSVVATTFITASVATSPSGPVDVKEATIKPGQAKESNYSW